METQNLVNIGSHGNGASQCCYNIVATLRVFPEGPSTPFEAHQVLFVRAEVLRPVNPMGSCRAWSVYLTTCLLGRLSPLSG